MLADFFFLGAVGDCVVVVVPLLNSLNKNACRLNQESWSWPLAFYLLSQKLESFGNIILIQASFTIICNIHCKEVSLWKFFNAFSKMF